MTNFCQSRGTKAQGKHLQAGNKVRSGKNTPPRNPPTPGPVNKPISVPSLTLCVHSSTTGFIGVKRDLKGKASPSPSMNCKRIVSDFGLRLELNAF